MSNAKYTPGPWQSGPIMQEELNSLLPKEYQRIYVPSNDAIYVCGTNQEAHAKLVAAAPEMVDALRHALLAVIQNQVKDAVGWKEAFAMYDAALKKAGVE